MKTWIAILNRTEARIFETVSTNLKKMVLVKKISNPRGHLRSRDINSDKPGISTSDRYAYPSGYSRPEGPVDRISHMFAIEIADYLDRNRHNNQYDKLVLVGDPRFIGKVKMALPRSTKSRLSGTLSKDLVRIPDHQLHEHIVL